MNATQSRRQEKLKSLRLFLEIGAISVATALAVPLSNSLVDSYYQIHDYDSSFKTNLNFWAVNLTNKGLFTSDIIGRESSFMALYKQYQIADNLDSLGNESEKGSKERLEVTQLLKEAHVFENPNQSDLVLKNLKGYHDINILYANSEITVDEWDILTNNIGLNLRYINSFKDKSEYIQQYLNSLPKDPSVFNYDKQIKKIRSYSEININKPRI